MIISYKDVKYLNAVIWQCINIKFTAKMYVDNDQINIIKDESSYNHYTVELA